MYMQVSGFGSFPLTHCRISKIPHKSYMNIFTLMMHLKTKLDYHLHCCWIRNSLAHHLHMKENDPLPWISTL